MAPRVHGGRVFGVSDPAVETSLAVYVKLLRAAKAISSRVEARLVAEGLTTTQLGVLEAILHKGPLTHRELGRKVLTSAANMTDVVNKLAARGLVTRLRCPEDHRLVHVILTPCGQALIERVFPLHAGDIAAAMAGLAPDELEALGDQLRTLGMTASRAMQETPLAENEPEVHLSD